MDEKAKAARNEYMKSWRNKNPEKVKKIQDRYWQRKSELSTEKERMIEMEKFNEVIKVEIPNTLSNEELNILISTMEALSSNIEGESSLKQAYGKIALEAEREKTYRKI